MADRFIVASDREGMILEKLATLEEALASLGPLLGKILTHLEAQTAKPTVPMASYDTLYGPIEAGPPEGELVAAALQPHPLPPRGWWGRLFTQRHVP